MTLKILIKKSTEMKKFFEKIEGQETEDKPETLELLIAPFLKREKERVLRKSLGDNTKGG